MRLDRFMRQTRQVASAPFADGKDLNAVIAGRRAAAAQQRSRNVILGAITLLAGVAFGVLVTDIGGGPIANVRIEATRRTGATTHATFAFVTDEVGRYELTLARGSHSIDARHDDYIGESVDVPNGGRCATSSWCRPASRSRPGEIRSPTMAPDRGPSQSRN